MSRNGIDTGLIVGALIAGFLLVVRALDKIEQAIRTIQ